MVLSPLAVSRATLALNWDVYLAFLPMVTPSCGVAIILPGPNFGGHLTPLTEGVSDRKEGKDESCAKTAGAGTRT